LAHYQLVSIHPFADGNGRSSRLLMNYIQAYHSEPLTVVFKQDKLDYYNALQSTRQTNNIEVFFEFMFDQAAKYFSVGLANLSKIVTRGTSDQGFNLLF
jgi:Fic family protein